MERKNNMIDESIENALFEILESEAELKYYLKKPNSLGYSSNPPL